MRLVRLFFFFFYSCITVHLLLLSSNATFTFPKVLISRGLPSNLPACKFPPHNLCPKEPNLQCMHYLICFSPQFYQFYCYFTEEAQALRTLTHSLVLQPMLLTKMDNQALLPVLELGRYSPGWDSGCSQSGTNPYKVTFHRVCPGTHLEVAEEESRALLQPSSPLQTL